MLAGEKGGVAWHDWQARCPRLAAWTCCTTTRAAPRRRTIRWSTHRSEEFWRVITLDLFGTFLGCRYGIPALIRSGDGAVINMASNLALMGTTGRDCYTAAKGGIAALTHSLAVEFAPHAYG